MSIDEVRPFLAMEILERAQELERQGIHVIHTETGEPDFDVPECVRLAAEKAIRDGKTHYTHSLGIWELREEIAAYYDRRYGVEVSPEQVIVTSGSSGGLTLLMALLLSAGDEVALPNPGYACYPNFVRAFHGKPVFFPLDASEGYQYRVGRVRPCLTGRTKALMVNSPANPTAAIQTRESMEALLDLGVPLISDEIYHGLEYGEHPAASMLEITDDAFVLDGFSKRYAMTGWRIGWLVAPKRHVSTLQRLQQNLFICAGSVAQYAGLAALREGDESVVSMVAEYARRRRLLLDGARRLGLGVAKEPDGAYYLLVDASHWGPNSLTLAHRILEEAHVGVCPGVDFGSLGEGKLRFSYASSAADLEEGMRRLENWLKRGKASST